MVDGALILSAGIIMIVFARQINEFQAHLLRRGRDEDWIVRWTAFTRIIGLLGIAMGAIAIIEAI